MKTLQLRAFGKATTAPELAESESPAPGAWVAQTGGNSAVGRYVIALARQRGLRTLSVVRRTEVVAELEELGADAVVVSGPDLGEQLHKALGREQVSLLLDAVGGDIV